MQQLTLGAYELAYNHFSISVKGSKMQNNLYLVFYLIKIDQ